MNYNKRTKTGLFHTDIPIKNDEFRGIRRAMYEVNITKWITSYIENYMKRPLNEETKKKYIMLDLIKQEDYKCETNKICEYLNRIFGKGTINFWELDGNRMILSLFSNKPLSIDSNVCNRVQNRQPEQFQDVMVSLYSEFWARENEKAPAVRDCTIQLTEACNLRCSYCYQINKKENSVISFDTAKKFIDMILNAKEEIPYLQLQSTRGVIWDFVGGESFVEVDLMDQICEYIIDSMLQMEHPWLFTTRLSTSSNGTLYHTEKVQAFLKKWGPMFSTAITVDGCKELHDMCRVFPDGSGSYDLAIAAVRDMRRKGIHLGSKVTISPDNLPMLSKAIINMVEEGYVNLHANPVFEEGWTIDHAKEYYRQLKKIADYFLENDLYPDIQFSIWKENGISKLPVEDDANWCGGNGAMIAVNPSGKIYPCLRYMESSVGNDVEPLVIGDVDNGIMSNEKQKKIVEELSSITRSSQSTKECMDCPVNEGCAWCTAYNYQKFGTPNKRATYICWMHKAEVLANVYYWNQVRIKQGVGYPYENNLPDEDSLKIISESELSMLNRLENEAAGIFQLDSTEKT